MTNSIPGMLQKHADLPEWFAAVMTVVKEYGNKRAELALLTGSKDAMLTVENHDTCSEVFINSIKQMAKLRDLIGGTIRFGQ